MVQSLQRILNTNFTKIPAKQFYYDIFHYKTSGVSENRSSDYFFFNIRLQKIPDNQLYLTL